MEPTSRALAGCAVHAEVSGSVEADGGLRADGERVDRRRQATRTGSLPHLICEAISTSR